MKKNCWEYKDCGREPGGRKARELGVCPAATEQRLEGVHGGAKAGRACWAIAGTFCKGEVQGTFARKVRGCEKCEFYRRVREEEGAEFIEAYALLQMMDWSRDKLILELQKALNEVQRLSGLLPICAWCKKIRDEKGTWRKLETYITEHSSADFSHGMCPECYEKAMKKGTPPPE